MIVTKKKRFFGLLWLLLYGSFACYYGIVQGAHLCLLWVSFWILYTPFFLRQKKIAHWLYSVTMIKSYYWPFLIWLFCFLYNMVSISFRPLLYQETFITSALSLLITHQSTYWPITFCCLMKLLHHFCVDLLLYDLWYRRLMHHVGNLYICLYFYFFLYWCYADFVVLLTVRS